jgi:predicted RecB family nuclease
MQLTEAGTILTSPSDLSTWASCEWAFLRRLDAKLGRAEPIDEQPDDMLARTAILGDDHEQRYLADLERRMQVTSFERPAPQDYQHSADAAADAMRNGAEALYQATFYDGELVGFADFILRNDDGEYEVYDTKLARHAKISALLQLAAYAEQIERLGIPVSRTVHLVLGDGKLASHDLADIAPVYRVQRDKLRAVLAERLAETTPLRWNDPRYTACGRCSICETQVIEHRDLVLVANMHAEQRKRLLAADVMTIDDLADRTTPVPGMSGRTQDALVQQARLQIESERAQQTAAANAHPVPVFEVVDAGALGAIPEPDAGDIFFDFEGDPLYTEDDARGQWGLDYLFGLVDAEEHFSAFWAHDFAQERRALVDFLAFVAERRAAHPGMHIYHYAAYERTHLRSLATRHGVGEDAVDDLLRANVLVDLFPIVRKALRVGSRSYSIKKLEPLYMHDDGRSGDVQTATASIEEYAQAAELLRSGDAAEGQRRLNTIASYNEYDCVSTIRLRNWLLSLRPAPTDEPLVDLEAPEPRPIPDPSPVFLALSERIAGVDALHRTPDQTALALAAAAIDYHRREAKTFWWEHFDRLQNPLDEWADTKDVLAIDRVDVVREWGKLPRARKQSRELRISGRLAPGSRIRPGGSPYLVYADPLPPQITPAGPGMAGARTASVLSVVDHPDRCEVVIKELADEPSDDYPIALAPAAPPSAGDQPAAIEEWGQRVLDALPAMLPDAALDLLRRVPPRGTLAPVVDGDTVGAVVESLLGMDDSYVAIQGPPGTGKTYVGSNTVARLVNEHGWKVGVVGQSHAVVENFLDAVVAKGVPGDRVLKVAKRDADDDQLDGVQWTVARDNPALAAAVARADEDGRGVVVGGTAWLYSSLKTLPDKSLDLLVIDEAGQFSLAPTIASSRAASRLLLLGDPQQLPQVSQGSHPEPVDESALGWLADGHDVLPASLGYFLAKTHRMHADLARPVSALSYAGQLESRAPVRSLEGVAPGLHPTPVAHVGNASESPEEAARVVSLVGDMIGCAWSDGSAPVRQLDASDVIVVAAYNAQVARIRSALDAAGFRETQVGTVDAFQGREAVVSIVSMAASSVAEIPRGLDFLLMPNRLNVAISRAQWAAYLVHSPALTTALPTSIAQLGLVARFIGLVDAR